jgi:hypothetical protein
MPASPSAAFAASTARSDVAQSSGAKNRVLMLVAASNLSMTSPNTARISAFVRSMGGRQRPVPMMVA